MALEPLFPDIPATVSYRRYLLLKQFAAAAMGDEELALAWKGRLRELPDGTTLPDNFPFRETLADAGYVFYEDLMGATFREIEANTALAINDAIAVVGIVAAFAESE